MKSEFADEEFAHNANLLYRRRKRSLRTPDLTNATSITITIVSTTSLLFFTRECRRREETERDEGVRGLVQYVVWYESLTKRAFGSCGRKIIPRA